MSLRIDVLCQNPEIDSLKKELSKHKQKDSIRVDLLNTLAFKNYGINQKKLKEYADEAKILAKEISCVKCEARSEYSISLFYLAKGKLDSALMAAKGSLSLFEKIDNTNGILATCDVLGTIYRFKEDYAKAAASYNKALGIAQEKGNQKTVAGIIFNMGGVVAEKGELDEAVKLLERAITIYDSIGEDKRIIGPLNGIALIYSNQGRYAESLEYLQKCLTGCREEKDKIGTVSALLNMGSVYSELEEPGKALPLIQEALEISKDLDNEHYIGKILSELGLIYQSKKEYKKALGYFKEGLRLATKADNNAGKFLNYVNIASLHTEKKEHRLALINLKRGLKASLLLGGKKEMGESYAAMGEVYHDLGENDKAFDYALKGKKIADELSLLKTQKNMNLLLSKLYKANKNYKKAFVSFQLYKEQSDSLFNKENIKQIAELEYDYKYKQALDSANIRELQLTKTVRTTSKDLEKSQRNYLWAIIGFLLVSILLGSIIFYQKFKNIKSINQNIVTEQKLLRSQMTPHFIFNSLSVIQGMILNKEEEKSVSYLSKFSKLLRIILENSRDKTVLLGQELIAIESYLALHNLEDDAYQYSVSVDESIDKSLFKIPPMLMQPFVENAIEHGFVNQEENRKIDIHLKYFKGELLCTITDNGIGINAQKENRRGNKKPLATTITSERLEMLSKDFKMKGSVTIEDRQKYNEQGTLVTLNHSS